jgi:hypothetical protein
LFFMEHYDHGKLLIVPFLTNYSVKYRVPAMLGFIVQSQGAPDETLSQIWARPPHYSFSMIDDGSSLETHLCWEAQMTWVYRPPIRLHSGRTKIKDGLGAT